MARLPMTWYLQLSTASFNQVTCSSTRGISGKLARPDFDGLTGEKLFVLRSKDDTKLTQDFLPFLLQSDHFGRYVEGALGRLDQQISE
jgi:hypothetical protein